MTRCVRKYQMRPSHQGPQKGSMWRLQTVHALAKEQGLAPAAELARGMVPIPLIRTALPHASEAQQERLRGLLAQLA